MESKFNQFFEPGATQVNKMASNESAQIYALCSIAISLKRIADNFEYVSGNGGMIRVSG